MRRSAWPVPGSTWEPERRCCRDRRDERDVPRLDRDQAMRTEFGRPRSNMRLRSMDGDLHLGRPAVVGVRAQPVADHPLEARHGRLGPGTPGVAGRRLPSHAAVLGDGPEMAVALRGRGLGRVARHRGGARRHDDGGIRVAGADAGGDALLVVGAVAREGGQRALDPVEQGADLRAVVHIPSGQQRGDDPPGAGVQAEVQLAPRPAYPRAVPLVQPLTGAAQLQPGAVDEQVEGAGPGTGAWPRHLHRRGPAAQRGVVGHSEIEPEQAHDGADQPFGLAQGEPEHRPQGQGGQDGQARVGRLPAPGRPRLGLPGRDGLVGEPHRQAPAPAQAGVVLAPVRDLEPLPRNAVATVGVGFERHRASQVRGPQLSDPGPLVPPITRSLQQSPANGAICKA